MLKLCFLLFSAGCFLYNPWRQDDQMELRRGSGDRAGSQTDSASGRPPRGPRPRGGRTEAAETGTEASRDSAGRCWGTVNCSDKLDKPGGDNMRIENVEDIQT